MPKGIMELRREPGRKPSLRFRRTRGTTGAPSQVAIEGIDPTYTEQGLSGLRGEIQEKLRSACGKVACPVIVNIDSVPVDPSVCRGKESTRVISDVQASCMESLRDCQLLVETPVAVRVA